MKVLLLFVLLTIFSTASATTTTPEATTTTAQATTTTTQATAAPGGCAVGQKKDKCGVCGGNGNCDGSCSKKDDICMNANVPCTGTPSIIAANSYQFGKCQAGALVTCSSAGTLNVDRFEKDNCDASSKIINNDSLIAKNACIDEEYGSTTRGVRYSWSGRCGGDEGTDFPASTNTTSKGSAAGLTTFFAFALALMISTL